jgi:hypothetical protein
VNGQEVLSLGTIKLSWKWNLRSRVFDANFHVFKSSEHFDILFGVEYIVAEGMVSFNAGTTDVIAPLVPHKKIKACWYSTTRLKRNILTNALEKLREQQLHLQRNNNGKIRLRCKRETPLRHRHPNSKGNQVHPVRQISKDRKTRSSANNSSSLAIECSESFRRIYAMLG